MRSVPVQTYVFWVKFSEPGESEDFRVGIVSFED